jgi:hypothetical protein
MVLQLDACAVRLKELGARIKHVPSAIGYHWHPAFSVDQIPKLVDQVNIEHLILFSAFEAVGMSSAKATAGTAIAFKECTALVDVIFYMWTQIVYNGLPKFLGRLLYAYLHPLLGADELSG